MEKSLSILIAAVLATCVTSVFAQGTVIFNNGTGLVQQWNSFNGEYIPVPKGGGEVQLFWAASGTPYTPWNPSSSGAAWYAANPGWSLEPVTGFTTAFAGKFTGGPLTLSPLSAGASIEYVVIGWTGNAQSFDVALAGNAWANVSAKFSSTTGNPFAVPPGTPVPLANSFGGLLLGIPEPSSVALAGLGAATWLVRRRRR